MVTASTKLYAILGDPIVQALSPLVHNAAFEFDGEDAVMVGLRVTPETLKEAILGVRAVNMAGLVVTMPLKSCIIPLLDECEEKIDFLGAVNVVTCENGILKGYNTDGDGFIQNLRVHGGQPSGKDVFLFGAGGAARGLSYSLLDAGIRKLTVCNEDEAMARAMFDTLRRKFDTEMEFVSLSSTEVAHGCRESDFIINATPMGMNGSPSPYVEWIPWDDLKTTVICADVVHKPVETPFLKKAQAKGLRTAGGDGMMLYQGVLAYRLFTKRDAPVAVMKRAIETRLEVGKS
ncbi:shikimate dehydrogenase family protein [Lawsonibacter sp. LCP25S3_G6]|uniref:shikimate dehydrogenase family protein n=1 Tax=unclassified Lawsonibacter TaxID=2617946 RepID=UPI003F9B0AAF